MTAYIDYVRQDNKSPSIPLPCVFLLFSHTLTFSQRPTTILLLQLARKYFIVLVVASRAAAGWLL